MYVTLLGKNFIHLYEAAAINKFAMLDEEVPDKKVNCISL